MISGWESRRASTGGAPAREPRHRGRIDVGDEVRYIEIRHRRDPPLRPVALRFSTSSTKCDDGTPHPITHSSDQQLSAVRDLRLDEVPACGPGGHAIDRVEGDLEIGGRGDADVDAPERRFVGHTGVEELTTTGTPSVARASRAASRSGHACCCGVVDTQCLEQPFAQMLVERFLGQRWCSPSRALTRFSSRRALASASSTSAPARRVPPARASGTGGRPSRRACGDRAPASRGRTPAVHAPRRASPPHAPSAHRAARFRCRSSCFAYHFFPEALDHLQRLLDRRPLRI